MEYLGHIISREGVATNPKKIETMINQSEPINVKHRRGYLRLTGCYRKFVKGYGILSKPLIHWLKKIFFCQGQAIEKAF